MKSKLFSFLSLLFFFSSHTILFLAMNSYLQMSAGQPEEDEITWGSDELPMETLDSKLRDGETGLQTVFSLDVRVHGQLWNSSLTVWFLLLL